MCRDRDDPGVEGTSSVHHISMIDDASCDNQ